MEVQKDRSKGDLIDLVNVFFTPMHTEKCMHELHQTLKNKAPMF